MVVQPRQGDMIRAQSTEVISIEERTAELDNTTKQKLVDYFTQAYGDAAYARKLVYGE